jgi:hypothetical protein
MDTVWPSKQLTIDSINYYQAFQADAQGDCHGRAMGLHGSGPAVVHRRDVLGGGSRNLRMTSRKYP